MMFGGQGGDDLNSGLGKDYLSGGEGADIYDIEFDRYHGSSQLKTLADFFDNYKNMLSIRFNTENKAGKGMLLGSQYVSHEQIMQEFDGEKALFVQTEDHHIYFWTEKPDRERRFDDTNYCYKQTLCHNGIIQWVQTRKCNYLTAMGIV